MTSITYLIKINNEVFSGGITTTSPDRGLAVQWVGEHVKRKIDNKANDNASNDYLSWIKTLIKKHENN